MSPAPKTPKSAPAAKTGGTDPAPEETGPFNYEESVAELVEIVRRLEAGSVPLSQAMELWERGEKLAASCTAWLDGAKQRIEAAKKADEPGPAAESD